MRMIQVTDYGSPFAGSFVPMLGAALEEAEGRGWQAQVVLPDRARGRAWLADLAEHRDKLIFAPVASRLGLYRWLAQLVDSEPGPTILDSHFTVFNLQSAAIGLRRPDVTVYWHMHTVLSDRLLVRMRNRFTMSLVARGIERILCVAPHLAEAVRARGAPADKVEYFPNALDTAAYSTASPAVRAAARERLGLPVDATVLLHFGRDWQGKGGDLFLRAVALLRRGAWPDVVAASARGGEPARTLAAELGLADAVYTLDHVPRGQDLYDCADLLMATSRGEGMPLTVLEALASGLGVVASDISGHRLPGGEPPGVRIAPLDPEALAHAADQLLARDAVRAHAEGQEAAAWVRDEMAVEPWACRLIDLYERDLAAHDTA
jgi:glycosyltransferase involved in cell wall biosynthesis